jgi:putative transposase
MTKNTTKTAAIAAGTMLFDDWFDPIEDAVRERVRGVIETIMEEELDATLSRPRYGRRKAAGSIDDAAPIVGSRHGHRTRTLTGTFGQTEIADPARSPEPRCAADIRVSARNASGRAC